MAKKKTSPRRAATSNDARKKTEARVDASAALAADHSDPVQAKSDYFPIVGIGDSAGGLPALTEFFGHLPPDSGLAFVVVVHLSPQHESNLAELLQPHVKMPVRQATETVPVERNNVYVIPT